MNNDSDHQPLSGDDKDLIIRNYQSLVEQILMVDGELDEDLVNAGLTRQQVEVIKKAQKSRREAVEAAGQAIGLVLAERNSKGTH